MKTQSVVLVCTVLYGVSGFAFGAKPIKPTQDVDCAECVDTKDIANGAVTSTKLGADVEARIGNVEAGVTNNANDISQNTADISSNSSRILDNELDIISARTDIDSNTAAIAGITQGVQALANGVSIGSFLQSRPYPSNIILIYEALSTANYRFGVWVHDYSNDGNQPGDLTTAVLHYEDADCLGPAYVLQADLGLLDMTEQQGAVFRVASTSGSIGNYYVPARSEAALRSFVATNGGEGCAYPRTANNVASVAAFPNDPGVTGVSNVRYAAPITLGR